MTTDTIYLVAFGPCLDNTLEGFATDEDGIKRIIKQANFDYVYDIKVNLDTMRARAILDDLNGDITEYYIHAINRI